MSILLYSTNVFLKLHIQELYRGDVHYVWCSEYFDSNMQARYSPAALIAPSANPADIYRELKRDVVGRDAHSAKIAAQKASFTSLAIRWEESGEITATQRDEIIFLANNAPFEYWRPLIYVIPKLPVLDRLIVVPPERRAGFGPEYIIEGLNRNEFDIIEL